MKKLFGVVLLLMASMAASAQEVVVEISDFTGGTVSVKEKNGQEVTISVAPADGYYINTEDVEVIAVMDPASLTRASDEETQQKDLPAGVTLPLTLVDDEGNPVVDEKGEPVVDPDDNTKARNYRFTVPEGLGAWVWKANFHEVDKPVTFGNLTEKVSWEVTGDETTTTLILSGEGEAGLGASKGPATYPWNAFDDTITDIVVEEGIEAIGDGILDNCTALKTVTLKGQKTVGLGKNTLTKDVTVDVYGRLYNTYRADAGWSEATIASADSEPMKGVTFGTSNDYDVFFSSTPMTISARRLPTRRAKPLRHSWCLLRKKKVMRSSLVVSICSTTTCSTSLRLAPSHRAASIFLSRYSRPVLPLPSAAMILPPSLTSHLVPLTSQNPGMAWMVVV